MATFLPTKNGLGPDDPPEIIRARYIVRKADELDALLEQYAHDSEYPEDQAETLRKIAHMIKKF